MAKILFLFLVAGALHVEAAGKCHDPRGEHHVNLKLRLDVRAGVRTTPRQEINKEALKVSKRYCRDQGFDFLHSFYWERTEKEGQRTPYSVTHVICGNGMPSGEPQGGVENARAWRAHYQLERELQAQRERYEAKHPGKPFPKSRESREGKLRVFKHLGIEDGLARKAVGMRFCENYYRVVDTAEAAPTLPEKAPAPKPAPADGQR